MNAKTARSTVPLLEMGAIYKSFGGVHALTVASLEVVGGEVHALLGENGAGKSTLVKILAGAHLRDAGVIRWHGEPVEIRAFGDADRLGIRVVYQQLNILGHLTVAENLTLARERSRLTWVDRGEGRRRAKAALDTLGVALDLDARAETLRSAEKQLIEIARALWGDVRLVIMDEPTSSLGDREVDRLFSIIRGLRDKGISIIYISHKLDEVFRIADRITVLRDGRTIGTVVASETTPDVLISMMVGRQLGHDIQKASRATDRVVLDVNSLSTDTGLKDISFALRRGEVLGIYGLLGSGRTELARALFGADPIREGTMRVNEQVVHFGSPADAKRHGVGLVTEERAEAAFAILTTRENLTAASSDLVAPRGWLRPGRESALAARMVQALRIRTPTIEEPLSRLSGGNQQKVAVGRWLGRGVPILIMDDPTSGIDVGAKDELYHVIANMTADGTSVLMTSSELPELLALSDRILVLHHGRLAGILAGDDLTEENVLRLALTGRLSTMLQERPPRSPATAPTAIPD
jgi:ribose transport system ATP-binding protein